jgi:hypothetical protein
VWSSPTVKPRLLKKIQTPKDPVFLGTLTDVIGVYLNPPSKVLAICIGPPHKKGTYSLEALKRHSIPDLLDALRVAEEKVIPKTYPGEKQDEFLKFLRQLNREYPGKVSIHLIVDDSGTHTQTHVQTWLRLNPRFVVHVIPAGTVWLYSIEKWFYEMTSRSIRGEAFHSVPELVRALREFLEGNNPYPFVWTAL